MLIAVISDSHGNRISIDKVKKRISSADVLLFLGDGEGDLREITEEFKGEVYAVRGNCDMRGLYPEERLIELQGKKIFMCHGHRYGVKYGYNSIFYRGKEVGADIVVGSLMKNLGAGIATSGAYIVGKKELVEMCAERLTAPGIGKEIGPSLNQNTSLLKGLFFAPQVVASSLKTAVFASKILEELGYNVEPKYNEKRADIVQTIHLAKEYKKAHQ